MRTLLYSTDLALLDRWKISLSSFDLMQINDVETLYKEVLKEESALIVNLSSCGDDPISFLKPLIDAKAHILILDPNPQFESTKKILQAGVKGYGNLMMHDIHLNEALRVILDGSVWLYSAFIDEMVARLKDKPTGSQQLLDNLSQREKEVALCIKEGLTNKEIAEKLDITIRTVKAHTQNIYEKTGVSNRLALALLFNK